MTNSDQAEAVPASDARAPGATTEHLPGDGHMWVMVLGDMVIFGGYFLIYMIHRSMSPTEFLDSQQHLNIGIGVFNTIVLLTSSLLIARAVRALRAGDHENAIKLTYATGFLGLVFMVLKGYEWYTEITGGYTNSDEFFSFYYVMTGVHLIHVFIGLIVLGVMVRELRNPRRRRLDMLESGATYWHMVDLLWIFLFALLYVMR